MEPDAPSPPDPPDYRGRVDLADPAAVRWWCKELRVAEEQLRAAVAAVGTSAAAVRHRLGA